MSLIIQSTPNATKKPKYSYLWVIQQHYGYGWEDVSEYDKADTKWSDVKHDINEYRITGYPTRYINRREKI